MKDVILNCPNCNKAVSVEIDLDVNPDHTGNIDDWIKLNIYRHQEQASLLTDNAH